VIPLAQSSCHHPELMRHLIVLLSAIGLAGAAAAAELFNGKDLTGWELVASPAADLAVVCHVTADGVMAVVGKPVGYLATAGTYQNYRLLLEYRWTAKSDRPANGGVLVHIASGPVDRDTWPLCFQIQTKEGRAGDLLPMAGAKFAEAPSTAPDAKTPQLDRIGLNSEKPVGEWNSVEIVCRGDTIACSINGVRQNRVTKCEPHAGRIGIQLEGFPFELRNVRLAPLDQQPQ
jgi:Domain of Unknown Function (DUF1080)